MQYDIARAAEAALIAELFRVLDGHAAPVVQYREADLRVPCHPDEETRGTGMHKHHCGKCHITWKHDDSMTHASRAQFDTAHACPECGSAVHEKHGDIL